MIGKQKPYLILTLVLISSLCGCFGFKSSAESSTFNLQNLEGKSNIVPVLIIGSGPAGLMAATYGARGGKPTYLIEGNNPGGLLMYTTEVGNWPGEIMIKGPDIIAKLKEQALRQGATFIQGAVQSIDSSRWPYKVQLEDETVLNALSIVIATGASPRKLAIPGEEEYWGGGVTSCAVCDAPFFKDEDVVVVGGGDSAVEEAIQLSPFAKSITILVRKDQMRAAASMQARLKNYPKISVQYNVEPYKIEGNLESVTGVQLLNSKTGDINPFKATGVFLAIGHIPNTGFLKDMVALDKDGTIKVNHPRHETSVKGIFAAGDVVDKIYRQAGTSAGDGIAAGLDAVKFLDDHNFNNQVASHITSQLYQANMKRSPGKATLRLLESLDDLEKIMSDASDKPIVIEFWTEDCSACKQLMPMLQEAAQKYEGHILFAQVNSDQTQELAGRFAVVRAPTIIVLKNGKVTEKIGFLTNSELDTFLKKQLPEDLMEKNPEVMAEY